MEHRVQLGRQEWISARVVGDGPAIVLIHGIPGSAAVWQAVTERLCTRHRVIVPDLIGFGASSRSERIEDLWADHQADALRVLLDDLDVGPAVIVGHDFGGPVAAHLLGREPARARGLILAATNLFTDTPIPFPLSGILWPLVGGPWERLLFSAPSLRMMVRKGVGEGAPRLDPSVYVGDRAQARAIGIIFGSALRELEIRYAPINEMIVGLRVPAKIIWGDRDPFFPLPQGQRTAALVSGAELVVLAGAGHFLPEERPHELAEAVSALSHATQIERQLP